MTPLKALIIEDCPDDARLLVIELADAGYTVISERVETAESLQNALTREPWDIAFCDFTMPRFSGRDALDIVRKHTTDLPFIYVSGTIGEDVAVEAMRTGAQDYVLKNNLTRLAAAVDRELRESRIRREKHLMESDRDRLIIELQAALKKARFLNGFLTICAGCKSIRNDRNEWICIELFLQQQGDIRLSHGLCPDCLARLYNFPNDSERISG
ncbi:MAG TPA: response regulator [Candidatus Paceibacterota bacterium]|nr:response regulator [Candidatus Paceibacterota bacterium]